VTQKPLLYQHLEYSTLQSTFTLKIKNVPEMKTPHQSQLLNLNTRW